MTTENTTSSNPAVEETAAPSLEAEQATEAPTCSRPDDVPEKFWDAAKKEIRVDALVRSYRELERRLGRSLSLPDGNADEAARSRLHDALGRPASPDDYVIEPPHPMIEVDDEINRRLHEAGFTQEQAKLVYDLAAERLLPALADAQANLAAQRDLDRLEQHFGNGEAWQQASRQLRAWGERSLSPDVYAALASSADGVLVMHDMMRRAEPEIVGQTGSGSSDLNEARLNEMMRDPRYWRDRDPSFVARVTEGFRRLYTG